MESNPIHPDGWGAQPAGTDAAAKKPTGSWMAAGEAKKGPDHWSSVEIVNFWAEVCRGLDECRIREIEGERERSELKF